MVSRVPEYRIAVLFDMDGLMLDTERMARRAWTSALAAHGYAMDEPSYLRLLGRTAGDVQQILRELFGPELPFVEIYRMRTANYEADIASNGIRTRPGLLELLDFLEEKNIPKAVASSTVNWFVLHKLERAGIAQRFSTIVSGDQVPRGKPEPDIFLEAARRLGVDPVKCVVLEDSEAGITAAHRAGMIPIMIPDLKPPTPEVRALAYRVLPSLHEVIPVVEKFLS
jgi:HAD superfamily hydrolase (TIGR01509 family)